MSRVEAAFALMMLAFLLADENAESGRNVLSFMWAFTAFMWLITAIYRSIRRKP